MKARWLGAFISSLIACSAPEGSEVDEWGQQQASLEPGDIGGPIVGQPVSRTPSGCAAIAGQSGALLCQTYASYESCRRLMGSAGFKRCERDGDREAVAVYAASSVAYSAIIGGGCKRIVSGDYECQTDAAFENCLRYARGNSPLRACYRDRDQLWSAGFRDRDGDMDARLSGCTVAGRDWLCNTERGQVETCQAYRRGGSSRISTCKLDLDAEFDPPPPFRVTRITLPSSQVNVTGAMVASIYRYERRSRLTSWASFSMTPSYSAPTARPDCTPCGPWTCEPKCQKLEFVSDHRREHTPDGISSISGINLNGCTGSLGGGFDELIDGETGDRVLWQSEVEDAYVACQAEAERLGRRTWSHWAKVSVYRYPTAVYHWTDPQITYVHDVTPTSEQESCSLVNNSNLVAASREIVLATSLRCTE